MGFDNKLKLVTNGTSKYFISDHLGSTNALTDSSGAILEQTAYDSFGNATTNLSTRYQYTGREFDNFTGLHYYRARWYDANLGRFISEDPIGFAGGDINLFGYVKNRSLKYRDPSGLDDADREWENKINPPRPNPNPWYWSHNESADNTESQVKTARPLYNFGCSGSGLGVGGFADFANNYTDMRRANTIGADKFFHCMANCQSSRRGSLGNLIANTVSEGRELFDEYVKGDSRKFCDEDRFANETGRNGGNACQPCEDACSQFKPRGLVFPAPNTLINYGNHGDCGKFGNWRCK